MKASNVFPTDLDLTLDRVLSTDITKGLFVMMVENPSQSQRPVLEQAGGYFPACPYVFGQAAVAFVLVYWPLDTERMDAIRQAVKASCDFP